MCVYSMIMDHYTDKWKDRLPHQTLPPVEIFPPIVPSVPVPFITKEEVEEFRKLLERAKEYDKKNNEPDCELEEKKETLRKLAKQLGIDITFPEDK